MKKTKQTLYCMLAIAFCLLAPVQIKAQDDTNVGIYVDSVKVKELTCYSFANLTVVLPYNSNYKQYDQITITFYSSYKEEGSVWTGRTYNNISKAAMFKYVKGNYLVYEIFSNKEQLYANGSQDPKQLGVDRGRLQMQGRTGKLLDNTFLIELDGSTITGYEENYSSACNCIEKQPTYKTESLLRMEIPCQNKTKKTNVDMSKPCVVPGTKVDFNNLGK